MSVKPHKARWKKINSDTQKKAGNQSSTVCKVCIVENVKKPTTLYSVFHKLKTTNEPNLVQLLGN